MRDWRARALKHLRPTPEEDARVHEDAEAFRRAVEEHLAAEGWEGTPRVEGSLAKGTYLHGQADADVFIQFPTDLDRDALVDRVHALKHLLDDGVVAYAEHPYAQGTFRGHKAEIVPCYAIDDPGEMLSAVDRTPFHTEYVKEALTDELRDEVRLLKAFLTAAGAYGAEEAIQGVSGYLAELLTLAHGSLEAVLTWAVQGFPHPVTLDGEPAAAFEDPLVVVDPVDPDRNAAAAVARPALQRVREGAAAFRADPHERFFQAPPPATLGTEQALARVRKRASRVLALAVPVHEAELTDPLFAQLRRAATLAAEELERDQVPVLATRVILEPEDEPELGWVLVEANRTALHEPYVHQGPPEAAGEHADRFRERWAGDPQAADDVYAEDGRLYVDLDREATTLTGIVRPHVEDAKAGKIVDAALEDGTARWLEGEDAIADLPPRPLGALLDRRRPWERWTDAGRDDHAGG